MAASVCGGSGQVEVTPVDARIVSHGLEHGLVGGAHAQERQAPRGRAVPGHLLIEAVDGQLRARAQEERYGVRGAIHSMDGPRDGAERAREDVQVVRQGGGLEGHGDVDVAVVEVVDAARREHAEPDLRERGHPLELLAHETVGVAVDPDHAIEGMGPVGPVARHVVGEAIGLRPDGQVGIERDQRNGRRAELRRIGGGARAPG
jgi:hypothetical protein